VWIVLEKFSELTHLNIDRAISRLMIAAKAGCRDPFACQRLIGMADK